MTSTTQPRDNSTVVPSSDLRELIPALHLLRASGLAIDPRKMLLGGLALVLLLVGDLLFGYLPFAQDSTSVQSITQSQPTVAGTLLGCCGFVPKPEIREWISWEATAFSLLTPIRSVVEPARASFEVEASWPKLAFAWTQLLWALVVWSLVGGALCRMNALQFATKKRIGVGAALKFSRRQLLGYLVAPFLPLSAILILKGFNWLLGCLASLVPSVGFVVLGIGWVVVLFSGFLMAMLTLGIAIGWPLMIAAISTEDSDGFDGLSRAFGYLIDRPWQAGLYVVSSLPVFAVSRIFVVILIILTISLGAAAVEQGAGFHDSASVSHVEYSFGNRMGLRAAVVADRLNALLTLDRSFSWPGNLANNALVVWTVIPCLLCFGFGPSFFWSATTISYFLLRQSDDGTPLDSVVDWPEKTDSDQTAAAGGVLEEPAPDSES